MNIPFSSLFPLTIAFVTITLALTSCQVSETPRSEVDVPAAPVLSAEASMRMMEISDGFEVRLVASEPLVTTPVGERTIVRSATVEGEKKVDTFITDETDKSDGVCLKLWL